MLQVDRMGRQSNLPALQKLHTLVQSTAPLPARTPKQHFVSKARPADALYTSLGLQATCPMQRTIVTCTKPHRSNLPTPCSLWLVQITTAWEGFRVLPRMP